MLSVLMLQSIDTWIFNYAVVFLLNHTYYVNIASVCEISLVEQNSYLGFLFRIWCIGEFYIKLQYPLARIHFVLMIKLFIIKASLIFILGWFSKNNKLAKWGK